MKMINKIREVNTIVKWSYGDYPSNNYNANTLTLDFELNGSKTIYSSYDMVIAFQGYNSKGDYFDCICKNCWGKTIEKHLNMINPDKSVRLDYDVFQNKLKSFLQ